MKFVCDNCKAKYQIGDDKVAGKTVRMKCRKCGYNIKVTPADVANAADVADAAGPEAPGVDMPPHEVQAPASVAAGAVPAPHPPRAPAPAPTAARANWTEGDEESTSIMNMPVREAVVAAMGRAPGHPAPPAPRSATPRPVTAPAPHPPRPVTAAPPRPYNPPGRTVAGIGGRHDVPPPPARPVTRAPGSGAAVHHEPTPQPALHSPVPEVEWYVGIRGTPIGPVRVSVIRERAAAHEVDGESLVWREGLSEWRPLRTVPELLEVLAAAQAPVPQTPAPPRAAPTPTPLAAVAALAPPAAPSSSPSPVAPLAAAPVTSVPAPLAAAPAALAAPVAAAPVAAAPPPAAPAPLVVSDPFAPVASPKPPSSGLITPSNGKVNGLHHANGLDAALHAPAAVGEPVRPPVGVDAPSSASAPRASTIDVDPDLERKLVPRPRNTHPMAYAFIAAAAVFSGVAAYVLLIKPPQKEIVYLPTPGSTVGAAPSGTAVPDDKTPPNFEVGDPTTPGSGRPIVRVAGPMPKGTTAPTSTAVAAPIDTSGFVSPVRGPEATGPSGPSNGSGGQLSQGEMNGVVAQNKPRVTRRCWQPALEAKAANASTNARVTVNITIGPSGSVESVSANGSERDYPSLAPCIAGMVRQWKFPPSGGSTPVAVPFVFAGQ